jgi:hypothetical protein
VLEADRPWEHGGSGVYLYGGTVLFDEEEQLFKMWYRTDTLLPSRESPHGAVPDGGYKACYAVSEDGRHWEKPSLRLTEYAGSSENNLIPAPAPRVGAYGVRRPNVIKDTREADPHRQYKMLTIESMMENGIRKGVVVPCTSKDGLGWRTDPAKVTHFPKPLLVNGELAGWDPEIRRYVYIHRRNRGLVPADVDGRLMRDEEALVQSTSADFEQWGDTEVILRRSDDDPPGFGVGWPGILNPIRYSQGLDIGFLDTCSNHWIDDIQESLWDVYRGTHIDIRTELVARRAGSPWQRLAPHWPAFRPGLWGTWDSEVVSPAKPLVRKDEILVYYTGQDLPMGAVHLGHPQRKEIEHAMQGHRRSAAIGLATLRLDGFASIDGHDPPGTVTTRPLISQGTTLKVNVRAPTGRARIAVTNENMRPLTGFAAEDADPFSGDAIRHTATWKGNPDLAPLQGKPIRLTFTLQNAALYAFQFIP